jgi:phage shock protein PspC (stress-responsive transcriptional regulator)
MPFEVVTPFVMDMNAARIFAPWTAGAVLLEVNHKVHRRVGRKRLFTLEPVTGRPESALASIRPGHCMRGCPQRRATLGAARVDHDAFSGPGSGPEPGLIPIDADADRRQPGTMNTATADTGSTTTTGQPAARQLRRSADDKMLAGVTGGIARYLDVDVTLVRVIIAALVLLHGAGLALYLAAWLLIPADGQDQSLAAAWIAGRNNRPR